METLTRAVELARGHPDQVVEFFELDEATGRFELWFGVRQPPLPLLAEG